MGWCECDGLCVYVVVCGGVQGCVGGVCVMVCVCVGVCVSVMVCGGVWGVCVFVCVCVCGETPTWPLLWLILNKFRDKRAQTRPSSHVHGPAKVTKCDFPTLGLWASDKCYCLVSFCNDQFKTQHSLTDLGLKPRTQPHTHTHIHLHTAHPHTHPPTQTHIYTYTPAHIPTHNYTHTHLHTTTQPHTHNHTHTTTHTHTNTHTHNHIHTHTSTHAHIDADIFPQLTSHRRYQYLCAKQLQMHELIH